MYYIYLYGFQHTNIRRRIYKIIIKTTLKKYVICTGTARNSHYSNKSLLKDERIIALTSKAKIPTTKMNYLLTKFDYNAFTFME